MPLIDRINHPDRRQGPITPLVERRDGQERRESAWVRRARQGALYGHDEDGKPVAGKILSGWAA